MSFAPTCRLDPPSRWNRDTIVYIISAEGFSASISRTLLEVSDQVLFVFIKNPQILFLSGNLNAISFLDLSRLSRSFSEEQFNEDFLVSGG